MERVPTRALFARYPLSLPPRIAAPLLKWLSRQSARLGDHLHFLGPLGAIFTGLGFLYVALFAGAILQLLGHFVIDLLTLLVALVIAEALVDRLPAESKMIERFCDESQELLRRAALAENARETGWLKNPSHCSRPEFPWGACRVIEERLEHFRRHNSRDRWVTLRDLYRLADDLRQEMGPFLD